MNLRQLVRSRARAVTIAAIIACALTVCARAGNVVDSNVRIVGIDSSGSLVLREPGGAQRTLQRGGAARGTPVFSPDGTRIAFVQATDRREALAALVVVGLDGRELARVLIEPVMAKMRYAGMRDVEAIRWLTPSRVIVRGSINPSQSQYYTVDVAAARVVGDTIDDLSAAVWSPDGSRVATTTGGPHFEADEDHASSIAIDDRIVYPSAATRDIAVVAPPQWSADGHSLGWVVRHRPDASLSGLVWCDGVIRETSLGRATADGAVGAFWSGDRWVVTEAPGAAPEHPTRAWAVEAGTARPLAVADAIDPLREARALRARLVREAIASGLVEPDAWCASCALSALPRSSDGAVTN